MMNYIVTLTTSDGRFHTRQFDNATMQEVQDALVAEFGERELFDVDYWQY